MRPITLTYKGAGLKVTERKVALFPETSWNTYKVVPLKTLPDTHLGYGLGVIIEGSELRVAGDKLYADNTMITGHQFFNEYYSQLSQAEMMDLCKVDGRHLQFASQTSNVMTYLVAFASNVEAIRYIPPDLLTQEMCLRAVTKNGHLLKYVPQRFQTMEVAVAAFMHL